MKDTFSSCVPLCYTPPDGLEIVQHCDPSAPVKQYIKWYRHGIKTVVIKVCNTVNFR